MSDYQITQALKGIREESTERNKKLDTLVDIFTAQTEAMNRQSKAIENLVKIMVKIEDNTNPDPKINAPSKRVNMNK